MTNAPATAHDSDPGDLSRRLQQATAERDELSRRLNDALGRLAASDAGAYSLASPGSGPQHDQLVQAFRQLKQQDFQSLSFSLYSIWQSKPGSAGTRATDALARCRQMLAEEVLVEGSKLLAVRRSTNADVDLRDVQETIIQSIRTRFRMRNTPPPELAEQLQCTIAKSVEVLRAMMTARPAACIFVPATNGAFNAEAHEALLGCPEQADAMVRLTIFPGYLVTASNRVLEKALVATEIGTAGDGGSADSRHESSEGHDDEAPAMREL
jgi:hypothetical protein